LPKTQVEDPPSLRMLPSSGLLRSQMWRIGNMILKRRTCTPFLWKCEG